MCHVLVIEDEPLVADHIGYIAEMAGATTVMFATTEAEAISAARSTTPAVILSDVDLKQGGTGPKACHAIRNELGPIPVIFITGTPEHCDPCDYAAAILAKPIAQHHIIEAFQRVAP